MSLARAKKSIENLKKVRDIIEISKFSTLKDLAKVSKVTDNALETNAMIKSVFEHAIKKHKIKTGIYNKRAKTTGTLFIYVANGKQLLSVSNTLLEKHIKSNYKDGDMIIAIGDEAISFAERNEFAVLAEYKDGVKISEVGIATAVNAVYESGKISEVQAVYHGAKGAYDIILPIADSKLGDRAKEQVKLSGKLRFYPSLEESLHILSTTYVARTITTIISLSRYFALKQQLLRHEESIKSIEDKVDSKRREAIKSNRKAMTEELISITSNAKRVAKGGEKNE